MAAKEASTGKRNTGSAVARELDQLKKQVKEQTLRLEREVKARKLDVRLAAKAKKARAQLSKEIAALREQGRKLASRLTGPRSVMRINASGHSKRRKPKSRI